ncbi:MAG: hypothetical protein ACRETR_02690, partial [Steroidobacteraceae bacterium]
FQAVQAIKNDPRTATIPILMYTSQEGELYLGQARALGAVGVLPKQIKYADVAKVLYQLHLIVDRRSEEQTTFKPLEAIMPHAAREAAGREAAAAMSAPQFHAHAASSVTILGADPDVPEPPPGLRRWLQAHLEAQTERIVGEIRGLPEQRGAQGAGWLAGLAVVACIAAIVATGSWWSDHTQLQAARAQLTLLRQAVASRSTAAGPAAVTATVGPAASNPTQGAATPQAMAEPLVLEVPYGADALGGPRLDVIRRLLERMVADRDGGVVQIRTFAGRFCLKGDPVNGYALASGKLPFAKCDVVGNPADDALPPEQRMPLALANLIAGIRNSTHGALDVETSVGDPADIRKAYPPVTDELTAGEWNRAGKANNRIEILVR